MIKKMENKYPLLNSKRDYKNYMVRYKKTLKNHIRQKKGGR